MDFPEGAKVINISVDLGVHGRDAAPHELAEGGAPGALPDLASMTPREQFDRLYNRVMQASEQGDTATANRFSPMALQAYQNFCDYVAESTLQDFEARTGIKVVYDVIDTNATLEAKLMAPCCWAQQVSLHQSPAADEIKQTIRKLLAEGKA